MIFAIRRSMEVLSSEASHLIAVGDDPLEPRLATGHCAPYWICTHAYVLIFNFNGFDTAQRLVGDAEGTVLLSTDNHVACNA